MCLELTERSSIATDTMDSVRACQMLMDFVAISVLKTIGRLRVERAAKLVIAMRSVQGVSSVTR